MARTIYKLFAPPFYCLENYKNAKKKTLRIRSVRLNKKRELYIINKYIMQQNIAIGKIIFNLCKELFVKRALSLRKLCYYRLVRKNII